VGGVSRGVMVCVAVEDGAEESEGGFAPELEGNGKGGGVWEWCDVRKSSRSKVRGDVERIWNS